MLYATCHVLLVRVSTHLNVVTTVLTFAVISHLANRTSTAQLGLSSLA